MSINKAVNTLSRKLRTCIALTSEHRWRQYYWEQRNSKWYQKMRSLGCDFSKTSCEELGLNSEVGNEHCASAGPELEQVIGFLHISKPRGIVDYGCGKGAALAVIAKHPFARILGIDISPEMIKVAQSNLQLLGINNVSFYCGDASKYSNLSDYSHFYFFNPFPEKIMRVVIDRILASRIYPGLSTIIYHNPVQHSVVLERGAFKLQKVLRYSTKPFNIYTAGRYNLNE
jgi:tRNA/tmRNA/rRNA uracil-C5-methylase (TrmA/RlmC/RlmD family)